jgi:hypothetical protein
MSKLFLVWVGIPLLTLAARPLSAQTLEPRLTMNGFLTQGVARSQEEPVLGIPTTSTTDYRTAALQVRYALEDKGMFVMQFSHRRVGQSLLNTFESSVEVDWVYYRHRFGPLQARAGRFPLPRGLFNEMRDVGTVIPLFRAPYFVYEDGTETVDGVGLSHILNFGEWSLTTHAFAGGAEYRAVFQTPDGPFPFKERVEKSLGGQLWLDTPIPGLRSGFAVMGWENPGEPDYDKMWIVSLEGDFNRWMVRGERLRINGSDARVWAQYAQAGFKPVEKLMAVFQIESKDSELLGSFAVPRYRAMTDAALGLNYAFSPNLMLKGEGHRARGYAFDRYVDPAGPPTTTYYGILSVAVSF